jgi:hypothetical protein
MARSPPAVANIFALAAGRATVSRNVARRAANGSDKGGRHVNRALADRRTRAPQRRRPFHLHARLIVAGLPASQETCVA